MIKKKRSIVPKIVECVILCLLFLMFIFPFYWMLITSVKSTMEAVSAEMTWFPQKIMWSNYIDAWNAVNFVKYGKNSILLSVVCVLCCLCCSVPCAYAFAKMEFRFKKPLFAIILSDMMIPAQCVFLPIFLMFSNMGWLNTYRSMIVLFSYSGATIFFIKNAFMQVSDEVIEAARMDGAGELSVMFKVALPMIKPVVVTMMLFCFLNRWNDYFWNLSLTTNDRVRTLPQAVNSLINVTDGLVTRWDLTMAGATMLMAPMLILYIFANKKIKNAFAYSGIK